MAREKTYEELEQSVSKFEERVAPNNLIEEEMSDGRPVGSRGTITHISALKKTRKALKEERDRAQQYFDLAGVIFVAINTAGEVTLINRKGCEVLGYEEDIVGKNWFDNFLAERLRDQKNSVSESLFSGETDLVEYYENPVVTKYGE